MSKLLKVPCSKELWGKKKSARSYLKWAVKFTNCYRKTRYSFLLQENQVEFSVSDLHNLETKQNLGDRTKMQQL